MASSREIIRVLKRHGFIIQSQNGSHIKLIKEGKHVIVPHPKKICLLEHFHQSLSNPV